MGIKHFFIALWKSICLLLFILISYQLYLLSKKVFFHQVNAEKALKSIVKFSICYPLDFKRSKNRTSEKEFECDLSKLIKFQSLELKSKTPKFIIEKFKKCKLESLISIRNLTEIEKLSPEVEFELYSDSICVRYQFEVKKGRKFTEIEIQPVNNNQTFLVLASFEKTFENDGVYKSVRMLKFKRTCRQDKSTKRICTETGLKFLIDIFYTVIQSLQSPFDTNCLFRNGSSQNDCYQKCVKRSKKHYSLSYTENDDFVLDFDTFTNLKPIIDKCTKKCSQVDCQGGAFAFKKVVALRNPQSFILLRINENTSKYKGIPYYNKEKLLWILVAFLSLIFQINLYDLFQNFSAFYNRKKLIYKSKNNNFVLIFVLPFFGSVLAVVFYRLIFNFGQEKDLVTYKLESVTERNVSVSICFNFSQIMKITNESMRDSIASEIESMKLSEIERLTWNESDFKKFVTMRNAVRIVYIRGNEKKIFTFYRGLRKCFLVYYMAPNHYTHIALQRKSEIYFNISKRTKYYYYLEDDFHYPKMNSEIHIFSYLHNVRITDLKGSKNCTDYSTFKNCSSQDDCRQECILESYASKNKSIPIMINLKLKEDTLSKFGNLIFTSHTELFEQVKKECKNKIQNLDCFSILTTFKSKWNTYKRHNMSVNLTPIKFLETPLENEDSIIILNRILSMTLILTGFSVRVAIKKLLSDLFSFKISFVNYQYLKRFSLLIIFILFLIHLKFLFVSLVYPQMVNFSFRFYSKTVKVPLLRLCYELEQNLDDNNYTISILNSLTLNKSDIFDHVIILDKVYSFKKNKNDPSEVDFKFFYLDNMKCFNLMVDEKISIQNINYFNLDEKLKIIVLMKNIPKKIFYMYINDKGVMDFDFNKPYFDKYYFVFMTEQHFIYQDDFWYIKNIIPFIKYSLGIEKEKNNQKSYSNHLKEVFNQQQHATTTAIPLYPKDKNLPIKNFQFQNFMHFRSLEGDKNKFDFTINSKRYNFLTDYYNDQSYPLSNKSVISFVPNLTYSASIITNKYHLIEFFLHLLTLHAFWFKVSLVSLPENLKKAFPVFRFFIVVLLYCMVVFLILVFKLLFSFIRFLDIKNRQ